MGKLEAKKLFCRGVAVVPSHESVFLPCSEPHWMLGTSERGSW